MRNVQEFFPLEGVHVVVDFVSAQLSMCILVVRVYPIQLGESASSGLNEADQVYWEQIENSVWTRRWEHEKHGREHVGVRQRLAR